MSAYLGIKDLAREYISGSNATGLALPWRYAASRDQPNFLNATESSQVGLPFVWMGSQASLQHSPFINRPVLTRFAQVATTGVANFHIKTLFLCKALKKFGTVHDVQFHTDTGFPLARTVATTGETVPGPFLPPDFSPRVDPVVELVHFEKSCAEHVLRRAFRGGRADMSRLDGAADAAGGSVFSTQLPPRVLAGMVLQLKTNLGTKWPECLAANAATRPVPMTALRDLWLAELDVQYRATARYQPVVVDDPETSQPG